MPHYEFICHDCHKGFLKTLLSAGLRGRQTHLSTLWQQRRRTSSGIARSGHEEHCLTRSLQAEKRQMADSKLNVACVKVLSDGRLAVTIVRVANGAMIRKMGPCIG